MGSKGIGMSKHRKSGRVKKNKSVSIEVARIVNRPKSILTKEMYSTISELMRNNG